MSTPVGRDVPTAISRANHRIDMRAGDRSRRVDSRERRVYFHGFNIRFYRLTMSCCWVNNAGWFINLLKKKVTETFGGLACSWGTCVAGCLSGCLERIVGNARNLFREETLPEGGRRKDHWPVCSALSSFNFRHSAARLIPNISAVLDLFPWEASRTSTM